MQVRHSHEFRYRWCTLFSLLLKVRNFQSNAWVWMDFTSTGWQCTQQVWLFYNPKMICFFHHLPPYRRLTSSPVNALDMLDYDSNFSCIHTPSLCHPMMKLPGRQSDQRSLNPELSHISASRCKQSSQREKVRTVMEKSCSLTRLRIAESTQWNETLL